MPYYPLSQITSNLYTNGLEYAVDLKNPSNSYSGYYWKTSDGKYFTGKTPQDTPCIELFVIPNLEGGENGEKDKKAGAIQIEFEENGYSFKYKIGKFFKSNLVVELSKIADKLSE